MFSVKNFYFTIRNMVFKQDIGIPRAFTSHLSGQIYLSIFFQSKQLKKNQLEQIPCYESICAINDDNEFSKSFKCIYKGELEHSDSYAIFYIQTSKLNMGQFFYKLFEKRDKFPFSIVRMPHFERTIPSTIFYGSIFSEFFLIAKCTPKLERFLPRASKFYSRMLL